MTVELALIALFVITLIWLAWYMRAQKGETPIETLIQQGEYLRAEREAEKLIASHAGDGVLHLQRADALQLLGRFEESEASYRRAMDLDSRNAAAREGLALSLAHRKVRLDEARAIIDETIATLPEIQEFQALSQAFILLESGQKDEALRVFSDNVDLLQTRFEMDYTDPDDLLAETAYLYGVLLREAGDTAGSEAIMQKVTAWAPASTFAKMAKEKLPLSRRERGQGHTR